jgi:hypothetical protein
MDTLIIGIGGTGARVLESITHLASCRYLDVATEDPLMMLKNVPLDLDLNMDSELGIFNSIGTNPEADYVANYLRNCNIRSNLQDRIHRRLSDLVRRERHLYNNIGSGKTQYYSVFLIGSICSGTGGGSFYDLSSHLREQLKGSSMSDSTRAMYNGVNCCIITSSGASHCNNIKNNPVFFMRYWNTRSRADAINNNRTIGIFSNRNNNCHLHFGNDSDYCSNAYRYEFCNKFISRQIILDALFRISVSNGIKSFLDSKMPTDGSVLNDASSSKTNRSKIIIFDSTRRYTNVIKTRICIINEFKCFLNSKIIFDGSILNNASSIKACQSNIASSNSIRKITNTTKTRISAVNKIKHYTNSKIVDSGKSLNNVSTMAAA